LGSRFGREVSKRRARLGFSFGSWVEASSTVWVSFLSESDTEHKLLVNIGLGGNEKIEVGFFIKDNVVLLGGSLSLGLLSSVQPSALQCHYSGIASKWQRIRPIYLKLGRIN
jgi:hypothetical protein